VALLAGVSLLSGCWQTGYGVPFYEVVRQGAPVAVGMLWCRITGCPADIPEGMSERAFDAGLLESAPVAIDVDPWGRVYVAEAPRIYGGVEDNRQHEYWLLDDLASRTVDDRRAYYEKWLASDRIEDKTLFTKHRDAIVLLEDTDGDGAADRRESLAEFGDMVDGPAAGVLVEGEHVFATVIPHFWRLARDAAGEWSKESLAEGFGVKTSLMGHDLHGLVRGPDGKLYFSLGDRGYSVTTKEGELLEPAMGPGRGAVFRMNLDGSGLEVFATGVRNPQELAFDDFGNLFTGDNNGDGGDKARIVYLVEGGETGWAMPFQTLVGDYVRGPWVEERLWELQHPTQPAWVLPPIAHLTSGPSGFAHYPGLGLPERYAGHFFLCDYAYVRSKSGVHSFALEPKGASFEMVDAHLFIGSILPTDFTFGWDGRMYVTDFMQFTEEKSLRVLRHDESANDPRIAELTALAREGMAERESAELVALLGHADRRIRLRAQYELAARADATAFAAVAADGEAGLLARIHAVWGLGQQGVEALRAAGFDDLAWLDDADAELRAQAIKVAGDTGASWLADDLIERLSEPEENARVRFFAAQALGALREAKAIGPLFALLRENADRDVFLRHAAVHALSRIGDLDAVVAHADDPDRSARLGTLLALRRADDARIAQFLSDPDPLLVVEAARAIYDRPIPQAMGRLAELAGTRLPAVDDSPQNLFALHRRVIGAALAVGTPASAAALAAHVADTANPEPMRELALEALADFTLPGPRDLTNGFYRPLSERPKTVVAQAFETWGRELVQGDLGGRALEIALSYDQVPLDDGELVDTVRDDEQPTGIRVASLRALGKRESAQAQVDAEIARALGSDAPALRAEARAQLALRDPAAALASIAALTPEAPTRERQRAYETLATIDTPEARTLLADAVAALERGELAPDVELEVLEAARRHEGLAERVAAWEAALPSDPVARRSWAVAGGSAERGRFVFDGQGDCRRCHGGAGGGGHGGGVGPELAALPKRASAGEMLRALVDPQAEVTPGYGVISITTGSGELLSGTLLEENDSALVIESGGRTLTVPQTRVASRTRVASPMPAIALALEPGELRDLIAYLNTL
jgi:quinoprotein glucose dehydrogenase